MQHLGIQVWLEITFFLLDDCTDPGSPELKSKQKKNKVCVCARARK